MAATPDENRSLVLLATPPRSTTDTTAVFRFRAPSSGTVCRLDGGSFRRCRGTIVYRGLRPGVHRFVVRVQAGRGAATRRSRWKVTSRPRPARSDPSSIPSAFDTLAFEDHFDGRRLDRSRWSPYNSQGHNGNGLRRPGAFSLDGRGNLVVTARMRDGRLVSGGMAARHDQAYGRYEFRVRTEADLTGTMSGVVLTWPTSGRWPMDGENDIYETGAGPGRSKFDSFVHFGPDNRQHWFEHTADASRWHTLVMDWSAEAIRIYRDGELVWTLTDTEAIPDVAHHLCIQLDAMADRPLAHPVRMFVDYVRIYR